MSIRYKDNIKQVRSLLGKMEKKAPRAFKKAMQRILNTVGNISAANYLQGPRPQQLGRVSSRLLRSIVGGTQFTGGSTLAQNPQFRGTSESIRSVVVTGRNIVGTIGTTVPYAEFHEEGRGAYDIVPKKPGGVLRFFPRQGSLRGGAIMLAAGTTPVFAKKVRHPGYPARPFLEPAVRDVVPFIPGITGQAIGELLKDLEK